MVASGKRSSSFTLPDWNSWWAQAGPVWERGDLDIFSGHISS